MKSYFILSPIFTIMTLFFVLIGCEKQQWHRVSGGTFGTTYNIIYLSDSDLSAFITSELARVDASLSAFNPSSTLSIVNRNGNYEVDTMLLSVIRKALIISQDTRGAFDITVAPLVNLWGFGFENDIKPSVMSIDSLREFIGYTKISLVNDTIIKADPRVMLDCSAIAKGYGCDVIAWMLESKGVENYMVEIGGEIVTKGKNANNQAWRIGITKPEDITINASTQIVEALSVSGKALATSGNYRNFYYKDGKKYAHTIDPLTGYPVQHNILSATVLANDCATADAYATAFMVMGLEKAKETLKRNPNLAAYLIYNNKDGKDTIWFSPSLKRSIIK